MNILLLSTGSVSAYLSHKLAYQLKENGHEVKHFMTKNAAVMMSMNEQCLSKNVDCQTFYTNHFSNYISIEREALDWHDKASNPVLHIDVVNWADVCVVCPADFNILGKMANGIADDVVSSILAAWLGSGKKLYINLSKKDATSLAWHMNCKTFQKIRFLHYFALFESK